MNSLFLKIRGASKLNATVLCDNKPVKFTKNKYGGYETTYETTAKRVNVKIYKYLEINNPLWWLFSWIFFIISIFGILEPKYDKRCLVINADFDIDLDGQVTEVVMSVNNLSSGGKAINVETKTNYTENANNYFVDYKAKKRLKIMKIVKWLTFFACIILLVLFIIKLLK